MTNTVEEPKTPEEMKMQALLERIAGLTAEYENKIADLRVAFTVVSQERDELRARVDGTEEAAAD